MKSNPKQKAVYLALCILAAIVVWIFVDNFGNNGGAVMHTKWFRDVPITYTGETVLTERGFMLLDEDTVSTVDLEMEGTAFDLRVKYCRASPSFDAFLGKGIRVTKDKIG